MTINTKYNKYNLLNSNSLFAINFMILSHKERQYPPKKGRGIMKDEEIKKEKPYDSL